MSTGAGFRFAQVDTGQIYLRHEACDEIVWRPVRSLEEAQEVAKTHTCPKPEVTDCPCGHVAGALRCLNGRIYGPCAGEHCDGPCDDTYGQCRYMDGCCGEEDE